MRGHDRDLSVGGRSVRLDETLGRVAPVIEIPEAGHHAMLDQPLLLLTAIRTLLADWTHCEPRRARDPEREAS